MQAGVTATLKTMKDGVTQYKDGVTAYADVVICTMEIMSVTQNWVDLCNVESYRVIKSLVLKTKY